jgi:hypothetical protein
VLFVIAIKVYKKEILDRLLLGVLLYLGVSIFALATHSSYLSHLYYHYYGGIVFMCISAVGLFTMFYSRAGFIGVLSDNQAVVRKTSLRLFYLAIGLTLFFLVISNYVQERPMTVLMLIGLAILRITRDHFADKINSGKLHQ